MIHLPALRLDPERHAEPSVQVGGKQIPLACQRNRADVRQLAQQHRARILDRIALGNGHRAGCNPQRSFLMRPLVGPS